MSLNDFDKKVLNELIDQTIEDIKPIVEFARMPELRSMYIDKDGSDFFFRGCCDRDKHGVCYRI